MSINEPQFPSQIWDGTAPNRSNRNVERSPDFEDWDQITAEVIATQEVLGGGNPIFNDVTIQGDLTLVGALQTHTKIADRLTLFADGATVGDEAGLAFERGATGDDALILWNEADIRFELGFFDTAGGVAVPTGALAALADLRVKDLSLAGTAISSDGALNINTVGAHVNTLGNLTSGSFTTIEGDILFLNGGAFGGILMASTSNAEIAAFSLQFSTEAFDPTWQIDNNGHFLSGSASTNPDNVHDIGSPNGGTTSRRPRTIYLGTSMIIDGGLTITNGVVSKTGGNVVLRTITAGVIVIDSASNLDIDADGTILLNSDARAAGGGSAGHAYGQVSGAGAAASGGGVAGTVGGASSHTAGVGGAAVGTDAAGDGGPASFLAGAGGAGSASAAAGDGGDHSIDAGAAGADGGGGAGTAGTITIGVTNASSVVLGRAAGTMAFFGGTAVTLPTDVGLLTDSTGGAVDGTLATVSGSGADAAINDNFADLAAKVNGLRTRLRSLVLMA